MIYSFLMVGQSNMAGRGFKQEVQLIYDEHIKMLRNGKWQTMWEPINYDRPTAGVSLAASFAAAWRLKNNSEEIGLIPCAEGGSSLDDWNPNGALFEHAIFQAKLAQKRSKLEGILWHQGENDSLPNSEANLYNEKFSLLINAFRKELNVPDIPIIIGGLGDYLSQGIYAEHFVQYPKVNQELEKFANNNSNCYFVSASGLTSNPDGIHIDAVSQRIFGVRYFEAFHKQQNILKPFRDEKQILKNIYNRDLTPTEKKELLDIKLSIGDLTMEDYINELSILTEK